MRLRHAIALGLLLPLAALGAADLGRLLVATREDGRPICKPYDPSCTEHGLGSEKADDFTDMGVNCVDDCLTPSEDPR